MHDKREPMPGRRVRAFDGALDENAILVTLGMIRDMRRSCCDRNSGGGFAQDLIQLILERQFFFLQCFDVKVGGRFDT